MKAVTVLGITTYSLAMADCLRIAESYLVALKTDPDKSILLITGETGTGKEHLFRALMATLGFATGVSAINLNAIPDGLRESELFGHERGSFSGASGRKIGWLERTKNAVLLDEIDKTGIALQNSLLRAIDKREFYRVGGAEPLPVLALLAFAGSKCLDTKVARGEMDPDFLYRIRRLEIHLPPLRERREDIPALVEQFAAGWCKRYGFDLHIEPAAMGALSRRSWPGNIRQLQNELQRLVLKGKGVITHKMVDANAEENGDQEATPIDDSLTPHEQLAAKMAREGDFTVKEFRAVSMLSQPRAWVVLESLVKKGLLSKTRSGRAMMYGLSPIRANTSPIRANTSPIHANTSPTDASNNDDDDGKGAA